MDIIIASKGTPLSECIKFAESINVGIEIKSFTSTVTYRSDWHGLLESVKKQLNDFSGTRMLHGIVYVGPLGWDRISIQNIKDEYLKTLEVAKELNVHTIIAHSTYIPGLSTWKYKDWLKCQTDMWHFLTDQAAQNNITIAIENIIDSKPDSILEIINEVNAKNLKVCIDFGHLNLIPSILTPLEWIDEVKEHLHYTHLHNNNGRYDSHHSINNGTIDFESVILKLISLTNPPKLALEIDNLDGIKESLGFLNKILDKTTQNTKK